MLATRRGATVDCDGLRREAVLTYEIPSDVTHVFGDYWDVYRMAFLSGKKVAGDAVPDLSESFSGLVARARAGKGKIVGSRAAE